tara:strand:- start:2788 stop:3972 length:1185 start_codon:yes stop_codon:yes gene_type:complete
MNIVLDNNSTNNLDLDFTDLSNVSSEPLKIEVNKANDFNEVKNFSNNRPSLTMSSKNVNIGLDLLANPNKVKSDPNKSPSLTNMKSSNDIVIDKIQEVKLDNIKEVSLDSVNLDKEINLNSEVKLSGDLSSNNDVKQFDFSSLPTPQPEPIKLTPAETEEARRKKYEEIQKEKFELLCLFERLEKKNIRTIKKFTMNSDIEEMRYEYNRIKKQREVEGSVAFQRKMLMAFVTAMEFLNNRFDPFDIKLDGWSESIHENLNDYDDVFEELYEKYNSNTKIAPELKLMLMVGGSGFMFHLSNTMFKSSLPGMGDIMKQNPELMKQFAKAAMSSMSNNNQTSSDVENILNNDNKQREMQGPPDIDEILNQISDENNDNSLKTINLGNKNKSSITLDL